MNQSDIDRLAEVIRYRRGRREGDQAVLREHGGLRPSRATTSRPPRFSRRVARGEKRIGVKMGFTSRAKMVQMGTRRHDLGAADRRDDRRGRRVDLDGRLRPPPAPSGNRLPAQEAARRAGHRRRGDGPPSRRWLPAIEIIDSRYRDFKFSLADVVADNCSSSGIVVGAWQSVDADLTNLGMILEIKRPAAPDRALRPRSSATRRARWSPPRACPPPRRAAGGRLDRHGRRRHRGRGALRSATTSRNTVQRLGAVGFSVME